MEAISDNKIKKYQDKFDLEETVIKLLVIEKTSCNLALMLP
jgi:hypothetical protein